MFKQINQGSGRFLRNASIFSLILSIPVLLAMYSKTKGAPDDETIVIHTGKKVVVLVNVFTVQPENEQKLVELLDEGTATIFSKQPGFISESIHRTSDGKRLVLYGQWEGQQYIDAFRKLPEIGPYFKKISELATVETVICNDVASIYHK
jgi:quinol monooxygenase YgiN